MQIVYKKGNEDEGTVLNIPECGEKCPLEKMYQLYDKILPQQSFEEECAFSLKNVLPSNTFRFIIS